ncbi:cytoskeletal protein binding protein [Monosporozyma unispora]|nr:cytoskeletal protein binding protein [Kazachstania unispora]
MTVFIGVYKAIYAYEPQTPEELALKEDDLLYLLAKSDIDEWWTVKKRLLGSETEEPSGLVPSNYIEEAPVIGHVKATYDYDQPQNPNEELVFYENDTFDVYDDKDPDWVLVRSNVSNEFGFVPGNYVEPVGDDNSVPAVVTSVAAAIPVVTTTPAPVSNFLPPPQNNSREDYSNPEPFPEPQNNDNNNNYNAPIDRRTEEEAPPPKPMRPTSTAMDDHSDDRRADNRDRARSRVSYYAGDENDYNGGGSSAPAQDRRNTNNNRFDDREEEAYDDFYQTWNVQEIDGRKKHKAKLAIGHNRISFIPSKKNSQPQEWTIDKLVSYDHEKKHLFLEFVDPYKNLELHTGNNDKCSEIIGILGEYKGASRGAGIKEIENASKTKRKGRILFDFIAESQDELTVKTGDIVYIINDKKSPDWWMCENVSTGQKGVIPAQFVEPSAPANGKPERSSSGFFNSIKKMAKNANPKSPSKNEKSRSGSSSGGFHLSVDSGNWKSDANQDIDEKKSRSKFGSFSHRKKRSSSVSNAKAAAGYGENASKKAFPDPKKSRMWVDRSGTFKVEAQFIGCAEGKIHLHKSNGVKIAVAADKLSEDDLIYVERVTGFSLDKYKQRSSSSASGSSSSKDPREQERERRRRIREKEEKERDRRLREKELMELKKARQLLDDERHRLKEEKDLPPIKPPRPNSYTELNRSASVKRSSSTRNTNDYDWFEFFLNSGVDVSNCQRYTINFDREQITEDMQGDINASMLRTLGLHEGDIVRVMKFLDNKFGREGQAAQTGAMFTQPDGSLKVNTAAPAGVNVAQQLLPQATAPAAGVSGQIIDDDAWTARPAAKSQPNLVSNNSEFTGSVQDLLDLEPLTPKKGAAPISTSAPEPNLNNLESVKPETAQAPQVSASLTGGPALVPLDPFKTGGNNILPISTSFVMMPFTTGGAMLPLQRTGGMVMPQTTFGAQLTGGVLPVQKTASGLIPIATTGGMMPQTTFGAQSTGGLMPLQTTGGLLPLQATGGLLPMSTTGGLNPMPATSFGLPPAGSILPVQKTGNGLMPINTTGGAMPQTSFMNTNITGGAMPQTSFMNTNITGGAMPQTNLMNTNITGGAMPQTSFVNQLTGGANIIPQTSFNNPIATTLPQTSFGGMQTTGGAMPLQRTGGFQPQSQFGLTLQKTGGIAPLPQTQLTGGVMQQPQLMGQNQFTGGAMQQPQMMAQPQMINNGVTGITQGVQNTFISQPQMVQPQQQAMMQPQMTQPQQPMLQTQPTGFGFGNGPQQLQQPQQQQGQANIMNASVSNPFGFA